MRSAKIPELEGDMTVMILGLLVFLGMHSIRILADDWRTRQVARLGPLPWKGLYALVSLAGFVLIVWGYAQARVGSPLLWSAPVWMHHVTALLVLLSFVLVTAAYVPGTHIKAAIGHPMVAGVKLWAFGHLLSNGSVADVVLFGAFLLWAALAFRAGRRRDRAAGTRYPAKGWGRDALAVVIGVLAWGVFAHVLHEALIGVRPLG
jgi:uncharacterized membrane protein